jgi:membrane protease YdiL (CAAX protease family)
MLVNAALSALVNLLVLAGFPFLLYFAYQKWHHKRKLPEIAQRTGLQLGHVRYLGYSLAFAFAIVTILVVWPLPLGPFLRQGSPQQAFRGLGLCGPALPMALLYGVVRTGFTEEFLFRGLIAGALSRRFSLPRANMAQALIFLIPHFAVLRIMPEMWFLLPVIFVCALFQGWIRIKSGSIAGSWLIHASANVAICLSVATGTAT